MGKTIQVFGFDTLVPVEAVTTFLEHFTGKGTVYAAEVKLSRRGRRPNARVQFIDDESAERIISLANRGLCYGYCSLTASRMNLDIAPQVFVHQMDSITLNFGCQISREKFLTLWKQTDVSVMFGGEVKMMCFFFCFNSVNYRLELSYQSIWRILLHPHRGQPTKFLLIQLFGAPRIYKTLGISICSSPKEIPDDQWVRTVDFTSSCIGQSSAICLELPYNIALPNFHEYFPYYKEAKNQLIVERGVPYCDNLALVPIVCPRQGVELPYEILFKVSSLVQNGCLPGPALDAKFFQLVDPQRIEMAYIEHALNNLSYLDECCYEPARWLKEQYGKYLKSRQPPKSPAIRLDDGLVYIRRVLVTPSKVYFCGPDVNMSNRVLRNYMKDIENFLRVSFVDEDWDKMYSTDLSPCLTDGNESRRTEIYERILSTLKNGIVIGNKRFEFLAFSSSQLRENSVWMFASRPGLTASDIRTWMGDFCDIRNVAKYAARLGQSFGSSKETLSVGRRDREIIPDINAPDAAKYVFSDGIGKISADFARKVATKCGLKSSTPSAFQIRYAGYKGVVAVDPSSSKKLSLRRSMWKYESENTKLDVLAWSKYQTCFLNRQIITLLSTLGITDDIFLKKLRDAVAQLDSILSDPSRAQEALELMSPGENTRVLKEMLKCGYKPDGEPFLSMMLQAFRTSKLQDLRTRARIFVQDGRTMMGCLDETGILEYGQVFVQYSGARRRPFYKDSLRSSNGRNFILEGRVVVAKNPCLHPGDVRVLRAVNVPELHHLVDCIVFPQKGMRPHPNECSGSDLDGDVYFVCWDPDLIPPKQIPPMDYTAAPSMVLDHDVTIEEVMEYFTNYILNDSLGIIANAHTVFADNEQDKAMSNSCIQLAKLFSIAVDFPKTGVPAAIPSHLRVKEYPDFMEKSDKTTYESQQVIGKLYREVKNLPQAHAIESYTEEVARKSYDPNMEVDGFESYIDEAFDYKTQYDYELGYLMKFYRIKTEAEILGGGMMKMSRSFDRRKDAEAISYAMTSLKEKARRWFGKKASKAEAYAKASAWYHVTYHPTYWGCYNEGTNQDHFISFPWCIYDKLIEIKKRNSNRKQLHISSLGLQFNYV